MKWLMAFVKEILVYMEGRVNFLKMVAIFAIALKNTGEEGKNILLVLTSSF